MISVETTQQPLSLPHDQQSLNSSPSPLQNCPKSQLESRAKSHAVVVAALPAKETSSDNNSTNSNCKENSGKERHSTPAPSQPLDASEIQATLQLQISEKTKCPHFKALVHCNTCKNIICSHGLKKKLCRDCFGRFAYHCSHLATGVCAACSKSSKCQHSRSRYQCKDCGGAGVCSHGRLKYRCKFCKGASICTHNRVRWTCEVCEFTGKCRHRILKLDCTRCRPKNATLSSSFDGGSGLVQEPKSKSRLCVHQMIFKDCKQCQYLFTIAFPSRSASPSSTNSVATTCHSYLQDQHKPLPSFQEMIKVSDQQLRYQTPIPLPPPSRLLSSPAPTSSASLSPDSYHPRNLANLFYSSPPPASIAEYEERIPSSYFNLKSPQHHDQQYFPIILPPIIDQQSHLSTPPPYTPAAQSQNHQSGKDNHFFRYF